MSERDDWAEINRLEAELAQARAELAAAQMHAAKMHAQRDEAVRNEAWAIKERDKLRAARAAAKRGRLEEDWMVAFHNADAKTAKDHAKQFMETNFAEAIYIDRNTNWQIIQTVLATAFRVAETRATVKARAELAAANKERDEARAATIEECAKVAEDHDHYEVKGWRRITSSLEIAAAIRALAQPQDGEG